MLLHLKKIYEQRRDIVRSNPCSTVLWDLVKVGEGLAGDAARLEKLNEVTTKGWLVVPPFSDNNLSSFGTGPNRTNKPQITQFTEHTNCKRRLIYASAQRAQDHSHTDTLLSQTVDSTWKKFEKIFLFATLTHLMFARGTTRSRVGDWGRVEIVYEWKRTGCLDFSDAVGDGVVGMSTSVCYACRFDHDYKLLNMIWKGKRKWTRELIFFHSVASCEKSPCSLWFSEVEMNIENGTV